MLPAGDLDDNDNGENDVCKYDCVDCSNNDNADDDDDDDDVYLMRAQKQHASQPKPDPQIAGRLLSSSKRIKTDSGKLN